MKVQGRLAPFYLNYMQSGGSEDEESPCGLVDELQKREKSVIVHLPTAVKMP